MYNGVTNTGVTIGYTESKWLPGFFTIQGTGIVSNILKNNLVLDYDSPEY
jgi:hypothetical protein